MSLQTDGVWKGQVWAPTVWGEQVWYEPNPTTVPTFQTFDLLYPRPFSSSDKEPQVELSEAEALLLSMMLDD